MKNTTILCYSLSALLATASYAQEKNSLGMESVKTPDCSSGVPFYKHNHCPAVSWCDNGDFLAIWFT